MIESLVELVESVLYAKSSLEAPTMEVGGICDVISFIIVPHSSHFFAFFYGIIIVD